MGCPSWTKTTAIIWLKAAGIRVPWQHQAHPPRGGTHPSPRGRLCISLALVAQEWACAPAADPEQIYWVIWGCY